MAQKTCPMESTIRLMGDRWSLRIVKALDFSPEPLRFNELLKALEPVSSKTLSAKLKFLQEHEVIEKDVVSTSPLYAVYKTTPKGQDFIGVIQQMGAWGEKWS